MIKGIFILFSFLTILSLYATNKGIGLQGVVSEDPHSVRSYHSSSHSSGGWSSGK